MTYLRIGALLFASVGSMVSQPFLSPPIIIAVLLFAAILLLYELPAVRALLARSVPDSVPVTLLALGLALASGAASQGLEAFNPVEVSTPGVAEPGAPVSPTPSTLPLRGTAPLYVTTTGSAALSALSTLVFTDIRGYGPLKLRSGDIQIVNGTWHIRSRIIDSGNIVHHGLTNENLATDAVDSRVIEDHSIESRDIDPNASFTFADLITGGLTANGDTTLGGGRN